MKKRFLFLFVSLFTAFGAFAQNEDMLNTPLTLEAIEDCNITFKNTAEGPVFYKVDGGEMSSVKSNSECKIALKVGSKVEFYGDNETYYSRENGCSNFSSDIVLTTVCCVYGNVMSLVSSKDFANAKTLTKPHTFSGLFARFEVTNSYDAKKKLVLPATTLSAGCYNGMFKFSRLWKAPELPATELTFSCYESMFSGCALKKAPELPATKLAHSCYSFMFSHCPIEEAPALPAMKMEQSCYDGMFNDCQHLKEAPVLPATDLEVKCYANMFSGAWNIKKAPALPATVLAEGCYSGMFSGCLGLTEAPELPAPVLAKECYEFMFYGCYVKSVTCLATDISATDCTTGWITSIRGTFTKSKGVDWPRNKSGIPEGWIVLLEEPTIIGKKK